MSEQHEDPDPARSASPSSESGNQGSRFLPGARIEAEEITATNVVSGVQYNTYNYLQTQKYTPPLHRPRRAEHFQDRVTERTWLLAHLQPGQIVTLCGPGGIGKTALVAEVLWTLAPGDTPPASFPDGLVFHSFSGQPEAAVVLEQLARTFGEDPLPTPTQAAQRALSGKHVLLVLDGAEEAENLEHVLAVCAGCAVLVTSRRRSDAANPALLLDLQRLPPDDAVAVVQAWQTQRNTDEAVIACIVQLVGGLPLALRLVGSYLALHQDEADEYLAWLEEDLFGALDQGSASHKSVRVLLERNMARLPSDAQTMLSIIGLFALAPFERELAAGILELGPRSTSQALGALVDYGLLVRAGASYEVSHPLIHSYARQVLLSRHAAIERRALLERLVTVLSAHFPEVTHTNWAKCELLVPHIQASAALLEQQGVAFAEAAHLFNQAGEYLRVRARYEQAAPLLQRALAIREQQLGPEHPDTASSLNDLAGLYWAQGKYAEVEPHLVRALAIREQQLGPKHPDTATSLNNLAELSQEQGKFAEAEPLLQRALAIREQQLGPEHPDTANSLHNLAYLYYDQGKYEQAELLLVRALAIRERQLGPEHPDTAYSLHHLALLYRAQGKYAEAEPLFLRALAIREQQLEPEHPDTATSLNDLAMLYRAQGKFAEAEPLMQRALAIREHELGANHPSTQIVRQNYTSLLQAFSPRNEKH